MAISSQPKEASKRGQTYRESNKRETNPKSAAYNVFQPHTASKVLQAQASQVHWSDQWHIGVAQHAALSWRLKQGLRLNNLLAFEDEILHMTKCFLTQSAIHEKHLCFP